MADYTFEYKVTWHPSIKGDGAYVREKSDSGGTIEYGPMSPALIQDFIAERKAFFQSLLDKQLEHLRPSTITPKTVADFTKVVEQTGILPVTNSERGDVT